VGLNGRGDVVVVEEDEDEDEEEAEEGEEGEVEEATDAACDGSASRESVVATGASAEARIAALTSSTRRR